MADDPLFKFLQSVTEKIKVEKEHKALMEEIDNNIVVEPKEDPLLSAINVLKQKIVEVKQPIASEVIADNVEVTTEVVPETIEEDNFGDFLSKLKGIISGDKPENITPVTSTEATAPVVQEQENAEPKIEEKKPDVAVVKSDYVDVLDKLSNEVAVEKEPQKISEIKKLIEQYAEKYFKKAAVMSEYAGGGGTNAVQYANGGTMNGDLNVTGNYLSAGVNLLNVFSGGGGGGPTDRLVNGSYQVVLSSNGAVTFPDNLVIDNSTISNLTLNDYGGGSSVLSGSQIEVVGDRTTITSGVTSTAGASILAARGQVTLDSNKAVMEYGLINSLGGGSSLISQGRFAVDNDVVMEQVTTNSIDESSSLVVQNQVIVNSNVLVGRRVTTITDGNTLTNFNGWTFDNGVGSLIFPDNTTQTTAFTGNPDSSNWDSTYTTVKDTSGYWSQAYTNLTSNSAAYLSGVNISLLSAASGSWDSNYTTTNANSGKYDSVYTSFNSNSGKYDSVYTSYNAASARLTTLDYLSTNNVYLSSTYVADAGYLTNINKTKTGGNVGLVGYNFASLINSLASTASPSLCASTVRAGSMTRAAGIDGFASTVGWGSTNYTVGASLATAVASSDYYTIPIYSTQNDIITINSIAQFIMIRSPAGPNSIGFLYSTSNNINTATTYSTGLSALAVPNVNTDISGVINPDLRNTNITIYPGTTGFIFIVPYGATGAGGTLRFVNTTSPGFANDLSFTGNVAQNNYKALTVENDMTIGNNLTVNNNLAVNGNITGNKATFYGNVEIAQNSYNLILKSPNGNRWAIFVTDAGALSATRII